MPSASTCLGTGRYIGHFVGIAVHDVGGISGAWAEKPFTVGVVFKAPPAQTQAAPGVILLAATPGTVYCGGVAFIQMQAASKRLRRTRDR